MECKTRNKQNPKEKMPRHFQKSKSNQWTETRWHCFLEASLPCLLLVGYYILSWSYIFGWLKLPQFSRRTGEVTDHVTFAFCPFPTTWTGLRDSQGWPWDHKQLQGGADLSEEIWGEVQMFLSCLCSGFIYPLPGLFATSDWIQITRPCLGQRQPSPGSH